MSYLDVNQAVRKFVEWRNSQGKKIDWTSFHENKVNDIRRDFTLGKIQKEEVAGKLFACFETLGIYLEPSEKRELEKIIKYY
jgi:hypothetical protein